MNLGKSVVDGAEMVAENTAGLIVIRVLKALAERAEQNGTPYITPLDVATVAAQLAVQLDARITEQLAKRAAAEVAP